MNERIKELAKQAGIKITPMIIDGIEYDYEDVDMDGSADLAKFAELIVKECGKVLNKNYPPDDLLPIEEVVGCLSTHFGVQ